MSHPIRRLAAACALASAPLLLPAGLTVVTAPPALAQQAADPAEMGFSAERLAALDARIMDEIARGAFPGAQILILRDGEVVHEATLGKLTPDGPEMPEDALFRIYSMTKPIVSVAALALAEQGRLDLSRPVAAYIPEFAEMSVATGETGADGKPVVEPAKRQMTVQDLLRHSAGLTYGFFGAGPAREAYKQAGVGDPDLTNLEAARQIAALPLEHQPGATWEYSRATDVLGAVVEVAAGKPLGEALQDLVLGPLGMSDTVFYVDDPEDHARIAEAFPQDARIGQFEMFDPRDRRAFESGGGGLVSTAQDYARFATMLLNGGELDGVRVLAPQTVIWMTSDHLGDRIGRGKYYLPGDGYGFGLGVAVRLSDGLSPVDGVEGEYNWGGAAGTYWWNDPENGVSVIYMMQSPSARVAMRPILKNMVYAAMTEPSDED